MMMKSQTNKLGALNMTEEHRSFKHRWTSFWNEERGIGTLEMIMIVAVIVVIAVAFRKFIFGWVEGLFTDADAKMDEFKTGEISLP